MRTRVGYAGGSKARPTYHSLGDHTETLEVSFDPEKISYQQLLEIFWAAHDPTARSYSRQYRSAIFTTDAAQREAAESSKRALERRLGREVRTEIEPATTFTEAEEYHQKYRLRLDRELMQEFAGLYADEQSFAHSTAAARVNGYLAGYGSLTQLQRESDRLGLSARAISRLSAVLNVGERAGCPIR